MKRMQVSGTVVVVLMLAGGVAGAGCATPRAVRPVPGSVGDATLSTRVKTALLNEPELGALRIDVNADSGVVTLTGAVRTPEEEQRALAVAKSIEGVRGVQSALKVETPR
jgi:hyperosmotically inducible periplasmic protein